MMLPVSREFSLRAFFLSLANHSGPKLITLLSNNMSPISARILMTGLGSYADLFLVQRSQEDINNQGVLKRLGIQISVAILAYAASDAMKIDSSQMLSMSALLSAIAFGANYASKANADINQPVNNQPRAAR